MAKLKLAVNPTFQAKVGIPLASGEKADVVLTFKHRTRSELAELMAGFAAAPDDDNPDAKTADIAKAGLSRDVDAVMAMVTGWDLADEFNRENVELLLENYLGAASAIFESYGDALRGAKRGN